MPSDTVQRIIAELTAERDRLDRAIKALGGESSGGGKRPGRKPMSAAQRAAVGKRMKAYWAKRRKGRKGS